MIGSIVLEGRPGRIEIGFVRKFILITTILSIYSEAFYFDIGIDFKFFYFVLFFNLFLLLIDIKYNAGGFYKIGVDKIYIGVLVYLLLSGTASVLRGTNRFPNLAEQLIGITTCSFYFYLFFKAFSDVPVAKIFRIYADVAFILIIIGYLRFPFDVYSPPRFRSIMSEPAHFTAAILPASYFYIVNKQILRSILAIGAIILSYSSLAFIGVFFGVIISFRLSPLKAIVSVFIVSALAYFVYSNLWDFRIRVDDTINAIANASLAKVNLSTYALISNYFVATKSFIDNPLFGSGLGSHIISHTKYIYNIEGIWENYISLNAKDANSLFLRLLSDMGLIGILITLWFIIKNYVRGFSSAGIISKAVLIYFFCKLLREGHYFV